ncbi:MAG TPA: phosphohistidine phosphatase SixA [Methylomirabilota bacterium]|nr:phosphohistidine phosphatase SixA [Methylomirabilota bacterium]
MKLYFLRHSDALDGADDHSRPLSPRGRDEAEQLARFLNGSGVGFDTAYSSPLLRARQTAEIILQLCDAIPPDKLQLTDSLRNETPPAAFTRWLAQLPKGRHVLLVGHAPSLAARVRELLTISDPNALQLPKAGLACVDSEDRAKGSLDFFITPALLGD